MFAVENPGPFDESPELGMGFHFGVVRNTEEGVIVLNGTFALTSEEIRSRRDVLQLGRAVIEDEAMRFLVRPVDIVIENDVNIFAKYFGWSRAAQQHVSRQEVHGSPPFPFMSAPGDVYVRFSAFSNDRRVLPDGGLRPGTFVTSERDALLATSGYAVVGRYALPVPGPAIYRFVVMPAAPAIGLIGTVVPAFNQAGGGVEIEFTAGLPAGSVGEPRNIPAY